MKISQELEGARLNITRTAELFHMDAGHLRRLSRRGVLPLPKRTAVKAMPFYDYELLVQISEVLRTGVGLNAEEFSFYRRREKNPRKRKNRAKRSNQRSPDSFVQQIIEGCKELGVGKDKLDIESVKQIVAAEFNGEQPELKDVIPVVARRLLRDDG
ncbi:MAG: hypothetical protein O7D91_08810 [Planctomycetota bacterium]|nr:hypothetical protein [Planctomycetota bacterium]